MYEYDFVSVGYGAVQKLIEALPLTPESQDPRVLYRQYCNARAREGWRLHTVTFNESGNSSDFIFERQTHFNDTNARPSE